MKKAASIVFLAILCALFFGTNCSGFFRDVRSVFSGYGGGIRGMILTAADRTALDDRLNKDVFLKNNWIDLFGTALRATGVCSLQEDDGKHIVRLKDDRLTFVTEPSSLSAQQTAWIRSLREAAQDAGTACWYVSIPQKTCPQQTEYCDRGAVDRSDVTDRAFTDAFRQAGYQILDLHERMHAEGLRHAELYYRTDHHWTDTAALWAADVLAQEIGLPTDRLDPDLYDTETYPGSFLGSEGKHFGRLYVGMDDFSIRIPRFSTHLTQTSNAKEPRTGTFSEALLYREYLDKDPFQDTMYGVYLGGDRGWVSIRNDLLPEGKRILLFKNSFGNAIAPYLALECGQVDMIDPRFYKESSVQRIAQGGYDAVVFATEFINAQALG